MSQRVIEYLLVSHIISCTVCRLCLCYNTCVCAVLLCFVFFFFFTSLKFVSLVVAGKYIIYHYTCRMVSVFSQHATFQ